MPVSGAVFRYLCFANGEAISNEEFERAYHLLAAAMHLAEAKQSSDWLEEISLIALRQSYQLTLKHDNESSLHNRMDTPGCNTNLLTLANVFNALSRLAASFSQDLKNESTRPRSHS